MKTILFVCTGNVFRSAAAHLHSHVYLNRKQLQKKYHIMSAGTSAQAPFEIWPSLMRTHKRYGINYLRGKLANVLKNVPHHDNVIIFCQRSDLAHHPVHINKTLLKKVDLVVCMAKYHQQYIRREFGVKSVLFNQVAYGKKTSIPDVCDKYADWRNEPLKANAYIEKVIIYIHKSIPLFYKNVDSYLVSHAIK